MDIVYILGTGSLADNEEIRFSVRSLADKMADLRDIYIIGEDPGFLPHCIHVPANDSHIHKHANAYFKILKACSIPELSDEFLLMNDDFFMLDNFLGSEWPFYALKNSNGGPCGPVSFHIHCPIKIKKEWFQKMPIDTSFKGCKSPRTFYSNFYHAPPKYTDDFIIRAGDGCRDFDEQIKDKPCFSIGDHSMLWPPFVEWLEKQYPNPSRFEEY